MLIFFILITYCGLQTFVINDDLPYSLFNRSDVRVYILLLTFNRSRNRINRLGVERYEKKNICCSAML